MIGWRMPPGTTVLCRYCLTRLPFDWDLPLASERLTEMLESHMQRCTPIELAEDFTPAPITLDKR